MTAKFSFYLSIAFILFILLLASCATVKTGGTHVTGTWKYELKDLPDGDNSGIMIISNKGKDLACHVKTDNGYELDFVSFIVKDGQLTGYYDQPEGRVDVTGSFHGNEFTGKAVAGGMMVGVVAKKEK